MYLLFYLKKKHPNLELTHTPLKPLTQEADFHYKLVWKLGIVTEEV